MLIEFSVKNFKSFKDEKTLSMVASKIHEHEKDNVFSVKNPNAQRSREINLLKSAAIYGANASGKSNLIKALKFMKDFVESSSTNTLKEKELPVEGFLLCSENANKPSSFEVIFFHKDIRYRYGFEVDSKKIHTEWLFYSPKGREVNLFIRDEKGFVVSDNYSEGVDLIDKTKKNALFLSVNMQFNGKISMEILNWFNSFSIVSNINDKIYLPSLYKSLSNKDFSVTLVDMLKNVDLGIVDLRLVDIVDRSSNSASEILTNIIDISYSMLNQYENVSRIEEEEINEVANKKLLAYHPQYNSKNKFTRPIPIDMRNESQGTQKFINFAYPIIESLHRGSLLVIDELEARMHPLLSQYIVKLFNSKEKNPNNAQFIFATHDTNLLTNKLLRRDQIWFCEKDKYGATDLYSLVDYKVRPDATFNKDYMQGKYGAIPVIRYVSWEDGIWKEVDEEYVEK